MCVWIQCKILTKTFINEGRKRLSEKLSSEDSKIFQGYIKVIMEDRMKLTMLTRLKRWKLYTTAIYQKQQN